MAGTPLVVCLFPGCGHTGFPASAPPTIVRITQARKSEEADGGRSRARRSRSTRRGARGEVASYTQQQVAARTVVYVQYSTTCTVPRTALSSCSSSHSTVTSDGSTCILPPCTHFEVVYTSSRQLLASQQIATVHYYQLLLPDDAVRGRRNG